jgi:hypothetical protein
MFIQKKKLIKSCPYRIMLNDKIGQCTLPERNGYPCPETGFNENCKLVPMLKKRQEIKFDSKCNNILYFDNIPAKVMNENYQRMQKYAAVNGGLFSLLFNVHTQFSVTLKGVYKIAELEERFINENFMYKNYLSTNISALQTVDKTVSITYDDFLHIVKSRGSMKHVNLLSAVPGPVSANISIPYSDSLNRLEFIYKELGLDVQGINRTITVRNRPTSKLSEYYYQISENQAVQLRDFRLEFHVSVPKEMEKNFVEEFFKNTSVLLYSFRSSKYFKKKHRGTVYYSGVRNYRSPTCSLKYGESAIEVAKVDGKYLYREYKFHKQKLMANLEYFGSPLGVPEHLKHFFK